MIIKQISVFLENRAGQLAEITGILAQNGVDLHALHIAETADYGVLRLVPDDAERAAEILQQHGFVLKLNRVVTVGVPDRPGGLHELLQRIAQAQLDITYMYSAFSRLDGKAQMVLRTENTDALFALLKQEGFTE